MKQGMDSFQSEYARFIEALPLGEAAAEVVRRAFSAGAQAALVLRASRASLGRDESRLALEQLYGEINSFSQES